MINGKVNWFRPLGLALLLCALASVAFYLEYKKRPQDEKTEESAKKPFVVRGMTIQSVGIQDGDKVIRFSCLDLQSGLCKPGDNSKWQITEPRKLRADDTNVNSLLSALNNVTTSDTVDLKDETPEKRAALLKEYGLSPEDRAKSHSIAVQSANGTTTAYLGGTHPISQGTFMVFEKGGKIDDSTVYIMPSYFKANFEHDLAYWRDKKLFTLASNDISEFTLHSKKTEVTAVRTDGRWTLHTKQGDVTGDIENVDSFLNGISFLVAKGIAAEEKDSAEAKKVLADCTDFLTFTAKKAQGEPVKLTVYERKKWGTLFAKVSDLDPVFELQNAAKHQLDKEIKDLRLNKLITSVDRFSTKAIEISGKSFGEPALTLTEKDGKWMTSDGKEADHEKVQKFLDQLSGNRIQEYLTGKEIPGGEADALRITLKTGNDAKLETRRQLAFWKKDGKLYARDLSSKRGEAYLVDVTIQSALPWERSFFNGHK